MLPGKHPRNVPSERANLKGVERVWWEDCGPPDPTEPPLNEGPKALIQVLAHSAGRRTFSAISRLNLRFVFQTLRLSHMRGS
eukprot:4645101-Prymnesium_polylepis.1